MGISDYKQPKFVKAVGVLMEDADKAGETGKDCYCLHTWNDFLKRTFEVDFDPPNAVKEIAADSDDEQSKLRYRGNLKLKNHAEDQMKVRNSS